MAGTLAINSPFVLQSPVRIISVFSRINSLLEKELRSPFRKMSHQEKALEIRGKVTDYVKNNYVNLRPNSRESRRQEYEYFISESTAEMKKGLLARYKELKLSANEFESIEYALNKRLISPKEVMAFCLEDIKTIFIDLEKIRKAHPKNKAAQNASFCLNAIHETLHTMGNIEPYGDNWLKWLNEGIVEILTKEIASRNFSRAIKSNWNDLAYPECQIATKHLMGLVGRDAVLSAFFKRSANPIVERMRELGFGEKIIDGIFKNGSELLDNPNKGALNRFVASLKKAVSDVRQEKEIFGYLSPLADSIGVQIRANVRINAEEIEYLKTSEKIGQSDAKLEVIRKTLANINGLKENGFAWIQDSVNEHLARKIMRKYSREGYGALDVKTLSKGRVFSGIAESLADLVGERALERAYLAGNPGLIAEQMVSNGFTRGEIGKLFELGEQVSRKDGEEKLLDYLRFLRRKNRNLLAWRGVGMLDAENENLDWENEFGKAGKNAAEAIKKMSAGAYESGTEFEKRLAEKNLIPKRASAEAQTIKEVNDYLLRDYNGATKFWANLFTTSAEAHLKLTRGSAFPQEIMDLASGLSFEFYSAHRAKPTLQQLVSALGEDIYHTYSHPIPISEFMGLPQIQLESEVQGVAQKLSESGQKYSQLSQLAILEACGIDVKNPGELEWAFVLASEIAGSCKRPLGGESQDMIEIILSSKIKAGNLNENCPAEKIIEAMDDALLNAYSSIGTAKLDKEKTVNYFKYRLYPGDGQHHAIETIGHNLSLIYPGLRLGFSSAGDGFSLHSKGMHFRPESALAGNIQNFEPYGSGPSRLEKEFKNVLAKHGLDLNFDPLKSGNRVAKAANEIDQSPYIDEFNRHVDIFSKYRSGGAEGIKFDMESERPNGFLTPEEVLEKRYALCLEYSCLFLALNSKKGNVFAFKVFKDNAGSMLPHVTPGVFMDRGLDYDPSQVSEFARELNRPFFSYYLFDNDQEYRERMLSAVGMSATAEKRLFLIDLSQEDFGAQHQHIVPITKAEELLSAYFVDRGSYRYKRGNIQEALIEFETALRINPGDELARSHLVAYYSKVDYDAARVMDLTNNIDILVNTDDFVSRAVTLLSMGDVENSVEALLRAVQISGHAIKARILLNGLMKTAGKSEQGQN